MKLLTLYFLHLLRAIFFVHLYDKKIKHLGHIFKVLQN